jgi:hypothetical protein
MIGRSADYVIEREEQIRHIALLAKPLLMKMLMVTESFTRSQYVVHTIRCTLFVVYDLVALFLPVPFFLVLF